MFPLEAISMSVEMGVPYVQFEIPNWIFVFPRFETTRHARVEQSTIMGMPTFSRPRL
jgi:hypothetical protein